MDYYKEHVEKVVSSLNSNVNGLSSAEAGKRLEENGKNMLEEGKKISIARRFFNQLIDPMIIVLLVAAALSAVTAIYEDEPLTDVFIILFVVIMNAVLGVFQENKAEKAIDALKEMTVATSKVMRDGHIAHIPSEDLVVGDVIVLEAGDVVPADARVLESASMQVEESALTGESVPVDKNSDAITPSKENSVVLLGDRKNMLFMGCSVVYGRGTAIVTGTGMHTEMGKIANALSEAADEATPLQIKLAQLSKILTYLVLGICIVIFAFNVIRTNNFHSDVLIHSFMLAISLAVAAIPEGLAAVVTIVLSIGVTKMSKRSAVIRRLTAVETLGCTQIICSDKTGTLTQNKMTVVDSFGNDKEMLMRAMSLCSDATADATGKIIGEPTEVALVEFGEKNGMKKFDLVNEFTRVGEAPFDSMRKMMSTVHQTANGKIIQFTKGAPDELLMKCTSYLGENGEEPLTQAIIDKINNANAEMANKALRVLGAAYKNCSSVPEKFTPDALENDLVFVGLTGMIDPIRPEVKEAITQCKAAGIRPIMITGDHKATAVAIAAELGIDEGTAITGSELNGISDEELNETIEKYSVYARVQPEHKVRIVKAWKKKNKIVAMTGDGVNDAPSIKSADIGVGMGITGTDVTKNVADMILADDNFATIVSAVEEGRRIYANIRKSIQFLLSSNLSEVISVFVATLFNFTILKPAHMLWINLITDSFPALALGMEDNEKNAMSTPPRKSTDGIFANGVGLDIIYQGLFASILTLAAYCIGVWMEQPSNFWEGSFDILNENHGITMAFITMSLAEIFQSFNMRSQRQSIFAMATHNRFLYGSSIAAIALTVLVTTVPFFRQLFDFTEINLTEYMIALGLSLLIIPMVEIVKFFQRMASKK